MTLPVAGSVQSFLPVARPTKFSTVFGVFSGNSSHFMSPMVVCRMAECAVGAAAFLVAAFAAGFFVAAPLGGAVWPAAARLSTKMAIVRRCSMGNSPGECNHLLEIGKVQM